MTDFADYLDPAVSQAREQFRALAARRPVHGGRQVPFLPAEMLPVPGLREHVPGTLIGGNAQRLRGRSSG